MIKKQTLFEIIINGCISPEVIFESDDKFLSHIFKINDLRELKICFGADK